MEFKKRWRIVLKCIVSVLAFFFIACTDCELLAQRKRNDECLVIVEKRPKFNDPYFSFEGKNPITNKHCNCKSKISYRWWNQYQSEIELGDTIIKKRGELVLSIHKKDTTLVHLWECQGKIYK